MGNASTQEVWCHVGYPKQFGKFLPGSSIADNSRRQSATTCIKPTAVSRQTSRNGIKKPPNLAPSPCGAESGPAGTNYFFHDFLYWMQSFSKTDCLPSDFPPNIQIQECFHNAAETWIGNVFDICKILELGKSQIDINCMDCHGHGSPALRKAAF